MSFQAVKTHKRIKTYTDLKKANACHRSTWIVADQDKEDVGFSYDASISVSAMKLNKINLLLSVQISFIRVYQR